MVGGFYAFTYLVRNNKKNHGLKEEIVIFDLILVGILTTPILSFAVLGVLVILKFGAYEFNLIF
ncbi:hypothetical protein LLT6_09055 [Lactococcus cremoris subsp. cremoris TIFN6]|uniref:DUF4059 family protein n=1 Tax=Lactococcus cremoris subsp. cremoris TIFN6 TaxID=1234876 RepID=T0TL82_LACLC|nr:hypothetical protein LLT6_09055 [Lactococcus cremoris subsp. cremoris TIFN6]